MLDKYHNLFNKKVIYFGLFFFFLSVNIANANDEIKQYGTDIINKSYDYVMENIDSAKEKAKQHSGIELINKNYDYVKSAFTAKSSSKEKIKQYGEIDIINKCYDNVMLYYGPKSDETASNYILARRTDRINIWQGSEEPKIDFHLYKNDAHMILTAEEISKNAKKRQIKFSNMEINIWEYTLCKDEYPMDSLEGATIRPAKIGENLDKYAFYYSQYETNELSARYDNYPFAITFNGQKVCNLNSSNIEGIVTLHFPTGTKGKLEVKGYFMDEPDKMVLGEDIGIISTHKADGTEMVVQQVVPLMNKADF